MTPEQFSQEMRTNAETGDWISAERACRAQAWRVMGQAIARGFAWLTAPPRALPVAETADAARASHRV